MAYSFFSADGLALLNSTVHLQPSQFHLMVYHTISFEASIINLGDDISWSWSTAEPFLFTIKVYFSPTPGQMDSPGDSFNGTYVYDYRAGVRAGQIIRSGRLEGKYSLQGRIQRLIRGEVQQGLQLVPSCHALLGGV